MLDIPVQYSSSKQDVGLSSLTAIKSEYVLEDKSTFTMSANGVSCIDFGIVFGIAGWLDH